MREKRGELIQLYWAGQPDAYYIKGHVDFKEAKEIMADNDLDPDEFQEPAHVYAKYIRVGQNSEIVPDGCLSVFTTRSQPRNGWFRVTEFERNIVKPSMPRVRGAGA